MLFWVLEIGTEKSKIGIYIGTIDPSPTENQIWSSCAGKTYM